MSINNQVVLTTSKPHYHDLQLYIGLEKAEQTPIVGVRHKKDIRTLVCQCSDRNIMFQENEFQLNESLKSAEPMFTLQQTLSTPQRKFFSFKFIKTKLQSDFNQYSFTTLLY